MHTTTITKRFTFDASHQLPNHDGKCRRLHGHTYVVEVDVTGPVRPADGSPVEGMVADFGLLKHVWKVEIEPCLDHRHLNDTIGPDIGPTTAENIAGWLLAAFASGLGVYIDVPVIAVRVWETPDSRAEARRVP